MKKLYHYTSLDTLMKILTKDNLRFLGSRYDSMNDPYDFSFARDIVIPKLQPCLEECGRSENEVEYVEAFPYIVSFSKNEDDFTMWRMYNAEVALELDYDIINETFKEPIYHKGECCYVDESSIDDFFVKTFNAREVASDKILDDAQVAVALLKKKDFENENEFRLFTFDYKTAYASGDTQEVYDAEIPHSDVILKNVRNRDVILCKEFLIPKKALTGITVNIYDKEHFEKVKSHINVWLIQNNYNQCLRHIVQTKHALNY